MYIGIIMQLWPQLCATYDKVFTLDKTGCWFYKRKKNLYSFNIDLIVSGIIEFSIFQAWLSNIDNNFVSLEWQVAIII